MSALGQKWTYRPVLDWDSASHHGNSASSSPVPLMAADCGHKPLNLF